MATSLDSLDVAQRESKRQAAELAALRRMLFVAEGTFSLSFAVFNTRRLRDELIKDVTTEFAQVQTIQLPSGTLDVMSFVREQITSVEPRAIFVTDLEQSLAPSGEPSAVFRSLNASRELWESLHCPIVFWIAERTASLMAAEAIDFWRYRSHAFEFTAETQVDGQWQPESHLGYDMIAGLPYEVKRFRRAELEQRLATIESPAPKHLLPHVLDWMYELAKLHEVFNDWQQSEEIKRNALGQCESRYGMETPETATALNNLASLLQATNRLAEAEPLMRRALAIDEQSYGDEHPNVAVRLNNLAQLLQATNRLAEAEPLMRRALAIDEQSYGDEHPNVAIRLNNLASLLQATNRLAEAEPLMRRALAIDEQSYGDEHPDVARDLNNLAQLLQATNRLAEAEPLMRRALAIDKQSYGDEHPKVAIRLNNLASLLQATNRLAEAEPLMRRALAIDEQSYGDEQPDVARDLNNLASLLQATNRLAEAEPLMRRALAIFTASLGDDHPKTQIVRRNYDALQAGLSE